MEPFGTPLFVALRLTPYLAPDLIRAGARLTAEEEAEPAAKAALEAAFAESPGLKEAYGR